MEDRHYQEQRARLADEAAVIIGRARSEAAEILSISRRALYNKLQKYGLM